jgi:DNA methyltransferase 1-associated protein 1
MGDIAQILGDTAAGVINNNSNNNSNNNGSNNGSNKSMMFNNNKAMKSLLGKNQDMISASLPPIVPTFLKSSPKEESKAASSSADEIKVKVGSKWITSSKRARPWTWAPFASSARTDGAMFRHWVRANVEYTDYPYAKFDIHLDPVSYTDDEYQQYLTSDLWTKSETDKLMELVRTYELRWPVVYDRWYDCYLTSSSTSAKPARNIEDLQHRYYGVAATLAQVRIAQEAASEVSAAAAAAVAAAASAASVPPSSSDPAAAGSSGPSAAAALQEKTEAMLLEAAAARSLATSASQNQPLIPHIGTGTSNKIFDYAHERERRTQIDRMWNRSKEEEAEEMELRKELRQIEAQLRKLKKSGGHILAAASATGSSGANGAGRLAASAASSRNPSRSATPVTLGVGGAGSTAIAENSQVLDQSFASTAPVPMPRHPYLQSGRLVPPATGGPAGINKSLLARMDQVLEQLHVPPRPMPTKRVCDLYDSVRKDVLTLVTLQKLTMQKEGQLQSKRVKLAKISGTSLPPEDRVLDEERLLGIAPPPKPTPAPTGQGSTKPKTAKKKGGASGGTGGGGGSKSKATKKIAPTALDGAGAAGGPAKSGSNLTTTTTTTVKKKTVKRKRKPESSAKSLPPAAGAGSKASGATAANKSSTAPATTAPAASSTTPAANKTPTASASKRARKS